MRKFLLKLCTRIIYRYRLTWEVKYTLSLNSHIDASAIKCKSCIFALSPEDASKKVVEFYEKNGWNCTIDSVCSAFFFIVLM